jgi:hypothetical protein
VGHAKFKQTGVDLKELEMASMMLVCLSVEQRIHPCKGRVHNLQSCARAKEETIFMG